MKELFGWTGKMLRINLSNHSVAELSSMTYASRFIGGRGLASRMYWDELNLSGSAFDPGNHLYFMTGPLCGTQAPAASRWIVLGKSPMAVPEQYASANLGGSFGAVLKKIGDSHLFKPLKCCFLLQALFLPFYNRLICRYHNISFPTPYTVLQPTPTYAPIRN